MAVFLQHPFQQQHGGSGSAPQSRGSDNNNNIHDNNESRCSTVTVVVLLGTPPTAWLDCLHLRYQLPLGQFARPRPARFGRVQFALWFGRPGPAAVCGAIAPPSMADGRPGRRLYRHGLHHASAGLAGRHVAGDGILFGGHPRRVVSLVGILGRRPTERVDRSSANLLGRDDVFVGSGHFGIWWCQWNRFERCWWSNIAGNGSGNQPIVGRSCARHCPSHWVWNGRVFERKAHASATR
mmetsp:Transcript_20910/g.45388  ORF Transcript_20910/g.45388 Transcript_20910/m.45388 type:complete len:238 (+) Transcript_20910:449-1162(+)